MPFTLDIEPPPDEVRERAEGWRAKSDCPNRSWDAAGRGARRRGRVFACGSGAGLALDPPCCCSNMPAPASSADEATALGADIRAVAAGRGAAVVAVTADEAFARAVAGRS